jgi:UDP-N-acetylmuramoyl-tripeptide--D-alanyl-D-alanine ligase
MAQLSLEQVLAYCQGRLLSPGTFRPWPASESLPSVVFPDVSTDTRTIRTGDLFVALRGARLDGHQFLGAAAAAGAGGLLIDEQAAAGLDAQLTQMPRRDLWLIVVPSTLQAYQDLAAGYRQTLQAPVIAITGSVGKTSTRGMVAACLMPARRVCQTKANNNNEIGLPQTLLSAAPADEVIVLEMGMRGRGEIELLSRIARPDVALITTIGVAHIERLGSQEEIFRAKAEIVSGLKPGGWLILNGDDPYLLDLARQMRQTFRIALTATRPLPPAAEALALPVFLARDITLKADSTSFMLEVRQNSAEMPTLSGGLEVTLPVPGRHMVSNALAGLAVAYVLNISLTQAAEGIRAFATPGSRQRLIHAGPVLIMDDSYNASPESMQAALETLRFTAGGRRLIAALGGMLELGSHAPQAHFQVGQTAARLGYDQVLAIGPFAAEVQNGFQTVSAHGCAETLADQAALIKRLLALLQPGDALLVKGSRAFAMEHVVAAVLAEFAPKPEESREDAAQTACSQNVVRQEMSHDR